MLARFVGLLSSVAAARKRLTDKDAVYIILISQFPFIIIRFAWRSPSMTSSELVVQSRSKWTDKNVWGCFKGFYNGSLNPSNLLCFLLPHICQHKKAQGEQEETPHYSITSVIQVALAAAYTAGICGVDTEFKSMLQGVFVWLLLSIKAAPLIQLPTYSMLLDESSTNNLL